METAGSYGREIIFLYTSICKHLDRQKYNDFEVNGSKHFLNLICS
jgi:hypothetical protein